MASIEEQKEEIKEILKNSAENDYPIKIWPYYLLQNLEYFNKNLRGLYIVNIDVENQEICVGMKLDSKKLLNAANNLHGGAVAMILDEVTSMSLLMFDRKGRTGVTVSMSIQFYSPCVLGDEIHITGKCDKVGNISAVSGKIINITKDRVAASMTQTKVIQNFPSLIYGEYAPFSKKNINGILPKHLHLDEDVISKL
eukprot:TRINITY_DN9351_c0_g1_i1.p1 TRINITY_DN9351_c0_g1~~TRINITY_DN9351_c0_g1_i1.p1  ORF type:complete len:197 (+),score=54.98 TRINITY_DN9351_c0_g1_i1:118-708(+)